jgi:hypothetical protein
MIPILKGPTGSNVIRMMLKVIIRKRYNYYY